MQVDTCAWKMIPSDKFVMGQDAERCGEVAEVKILRPKRKTDLLLCEFHLNCFIREWGLHYEVELHCLNWLEGNRPSNCTDVSCKKCLPDEPKTWRHS